MLPLFATNLMLSRCAHLRCTMLTEGCTVKVTTPQPMMSQTQVDLPFDANQYEEDRLARDAEAMAAMAAEEAKTAEDAKFAALRTPWKWEIRRRIWDLMEAEDYAVRELRTAPQALYHPTYRVTVRIGRVPSTTASPILSMRS